MYENINGSKQLLNQTLFLADLTALLSSHVNISFMSSRVKIYICYLPAGRSVLEKFFSTDRPKW